ncbi:MAG: hypothetical protein V7784_00250 [Oceanospirillaceae bacterium]
MSESNHKGRNQKLVTDYLEALLCETELDKHELSDDQINLEADNYQCNSEEEISTGLVNIDDSALSKTPDDGYVEADQKISLSPAGNGIDETIENSVSDLEVEVQGDAQPNSGETDEVDLQKEWAQIEPDDLELEIPALALQESNTEQESVEIIDPTTVENDQIDPTTVEENSSSLPVEGCVISEEENVDPQQDKCTELKDAPVKIEESVLEPSEEENSDNSEAINEMIIEEPALDSSAELSINCIIVLMYGLKLAIPFEQVEGHIRLSNVTLSLDNEREWILGDFTSSTMRTHIVDTAQILFGDNYDALKSNYNEMLVLEGKHWSIVFDKVIKAQNILLSDVTENPSPQFRPWLTGTYMAEKCALVNVSAMVKMFEEELIG